MEPYSTYSFVSGFFHSVERYRGPSLCGAYQNLASFLLFCLVVFHCMEVSILFIHSPADGHLRCFKFVAILVVEAKAGKREKNKTTVFEIWFSSWSMLCYE